MKKTSFLIFPLLALSVFLSLSPAQALVIGNDYKILILEPKLSDSLKIGESYKITPRWKNVGKKCPDRDFRIHLRITDFYGNARFETAYHPSLPTSKWEPGQIIESDTISLEVPSERDPSNWKPEDMPRILEGIHYILVSFKDPQSKDKLVMDCGRQMFGQTNDYLLKKVYITTSSLIIEKVTPVRNPGKPSIPNGVQDEFEITLHNYSRKPGKANCLVTIETPAKRVIGQSYKRVVLPPDEKFKFSIPYRSKYFGKLTLKVRLEQENILKAIVIKDIYLKPKFPLNYNLIKLNKVIKDGEKFLVPFKVELKNPNDYPLEVITRIFKEEELLKEKVVSLKIKEEKSFSLNPSPHFGYYRVLFEVKKGKISAFTEVRKIATTVEIKAVHSPQSIVHSPGKTTTIKGAKIYVNGEPFIVKGINVHSLDAYSLDNTKRLMEIMKDVGINSLRTDHPHLWQVELAEELNLTYLPLAPFTCTNTTEIFQRFEDHPLPGVQALTSEFIKMFKDYANVIYWNSANEVQGEISKMLEAVYPLYKSEDPYSRPVTYANLGNQNILVGQDIVSINHYFWPMGVAANLRPGILETLGMTKKKGIPLIFTELNSWWGPVQSSGEMAVRDLWDWGLKQGMSGGFIYQLTDAPNRHPGLIDDVRLRNIHLTMANAFKEYFSDLKIVGATFMTPVITGLINQTPTIVGATFMTPVITGLINQTPTNVGATDISPVITGLIRPKPFGFVCPTPTKIELILTLKNKREFTIQNLRIKITSLGFENYEAKLKDIKPEEIVKIPLTLKAKSEIKEDIVAKVRLNFCTHFGLKSHLELEVCSDIVE